MHAISQSAIWVKEPLADTRVVIVTSAALPKYMIDQLHMEIDDWDQVAYLVVQQSRAFMLDWLQFGSHPIASAPATTCRAGQLLHGVSKGCFLLDVEASPIPRFTWLGSVCGHPLRVLKLGDAASHAAIDKQVEEILSVTRTLVKSGLQERCFS
ncbi:MULTISPECIES: transketolase [Pseudomonas]|uniref:Transketolase n=1 Tax=Pseudomonas beijingensis TaxID=2954101 RepID=A0ABY9FJ18_9PSED|nr:MULTISPECIES: transketolase [unclassified Pseudomonas]WLH03443.1 transketolase [Pseudomonas sp. FP2034]WLH48504.1 transketolase [Pseudomonas sp. FP2262]WLI43196.1 transketolase [Pseudomonas sp. FP830]